MHWAAARSKPTPEVGRYYMDKFEGPEKKLELIFLSPQPGLRENTSGRWRKVVNSSGADIIHKISTEKLDGYLLSESSLFVWDDRVVMITCGKTTPVMAIPDILKFVDRREIGFVCYKRKNLFYPREQPTDFEDDRAQMLEFFPGDSTRLGCADDDHIHVFYYANGSAAPSPDTTLQVMMHDIEPSVGTRFYFDKSDSTACSDELHRLCNLYPMMLLDGHFFYPQGYSINGISGANYFTVHITPQAEASYASFETNIIEADYSRIISEVVEIFKPERFSVVLTTSDDKYCGALLDTIKLPQWDYQIKEAVSHAFDHNYSAIFLNILKNDILEAFG
jgi:S-adenosylmethionine decarboxylase